MTSTQIGINIDKILSWKFDFWRTQLLVQPPVPISDLNLGGLFDTRSSTTLGGLYDALNINTQLLPDLHVLQV